VGVRHMRPKGRGRTAAQGRGEEAIRGRKGGGKAVLNPAREGPTMLGRVKRWLLAMLALPHTQCTWAANYEASTVSAGQACA